MTLMPLNQQLNEISKWNPLLVVDPKYSSSNKELLVRTVWILFDDLAPVWSCGCQLKRISTVRCNIYSPKQFFF
jgi:hypothetical protein